MKNTVQNALQRPTIFSATNARTEALSDFASICEPLLGKISSNGG